MNELVEVGGDTDTIAAIAGQIAGARLGDEGLPARLLTSLPEREMIESVASAFALVVAGPND